MNETHTDTTLAAQVAAIRERLEQREAWHKQGKARGVPQWDKEVRTLLAALAQAEAERDAVVEALERIAVGGGRELSEVPFVSSSEMQRAYIGRIERMKRIAAEALQHYEQHSPDAGADGA